MSAADEEARSRARQFLRKIFKHRSQRSLLDERIYHGACMPDDFLHEHTANAFSAPPNPSPLIAGPLPRLHGKGAWGTLTRPSFSTKKSNTVRTRIKDGDQIRANISGNKAISIHSFGVGAWDGRKRESRGGSSEDGFTAVTDLFTVQNGTVRRADPGNRLLTSETKCEKSKNDRESGDTMNSTGSTKQFKKSCGKVNNNQKSNVDNSSRTSDSGYSTTINNSASTRTAQAKFSIGHDRVFHLFGAFDGHRSDHAARFCAEALGKYVTSQLLADNALRPIHYSSSGKTGHDQAADAVEEEAAICRALSKAVTTLDADFCKRHWVSLVRDNGKKFYVTRSVEVDRNFNIHAWDAYPLEVQFREALGAVAADHGRAAGITSENDLQHYIAVHQERWHCYKKELYPGAALCAVLVDEARGKLYCANVGDSGAMLYRTQSTAQQDVNHVHHVFQNPHSSVADQSCDNNEGQNIERTNTAHSSASAEENQRQLLKQWGGFKAWNSKPKNEMLLVPGNIKLLCRAHKPSQPEELARVCGTPEGFVLVHGQLVTMDNYKEVAKMVGQAQARGQKALYRINRDISLSRAIGDRDLKKYGVIGTPDITVHSLHRDPNDVMQDATVTYLVVATDGVWDVVSPETCAHMLQSVTSSATDAIGDRTNQNTTSLAGKAANIIANAAHNVQKNNDDVTAVVVAFRRYAK